MKVCIVSDSHDHRELLMQAVGEARALGAEAVLHCGDIVAPSSLKTLQRFGLPVHAVEGNNGGDTFSLCQLGLETQGQIVFHGRDAQLLLGGRKIFIVHYPHYAYGMACTGDWDLVCCGHEHRYGLRRVTTALGTEAVLLNPGTVAGIGAPPTYVLADLERMEFAVHEVAGPQTL